MKNLKKELKSIKEKGRPTLKCPKWFQQGIEEGDFAYQTNTGWKLTQKGKEVLGGSHG